MSKTVFETDVDVDVADSDVPFQRFLRDTQDLPQHAADTLCTTPVVRGRMAVGLDPGIPFV